jgi:hypothetical protein
MKYVRWRWFLPLVQLLFASFSLIYGPHQYKQISLARGVFGDNNVLDYSLQNDPSPIERASYAINFPALVLDYPLRDEHRELFTYGNDYTFVAVDPREIGFFLGIAIFWYWAGSKLDHRLGHGSMLVHSRGLRTATRACGLLFGVLIGAYAFEIVVRDWQLRPERPIGVCGIAWALGLTSYFAGELLSAAGSDVASNLKYDG